MVMYLVNTPNKKSTTVHEKKLNLEMQLHVHCTCNLDGFKPMQEFQLTLSGLFY